MKYVARIRELKLLSLLFLACAVCVVGTFVLCGQRTAGTSPVLIGYPMQLKVAYSVRESPNPNFHVGTERYTFKNLSNKPLAVHFPALAAYAEVQPNNFHMEDRENWPRFARERQTILLPPLGEMTFEEPFEIFSIGPPKSGKGFVFGPGDDDAQKGESFIGCVLASQQ